MRTGLVCSCITLMLCLLGCDPAEQPSPEQVDPTASSSIVVTSRVMQQFASSVWGDAAQVLLIPVTPGEASVPDRASLQQIQRARLVIWHGAGFEPWRDKVSVPSGRQQDLSDDLREHLLSSAGAIAHQHGPDGAQQAGDLLWATWLDPDLAGEILQALNKLAAQDDNVATAATGKLAGQLQQLAERADRLAAQPRRVVITDEQLRYLVRRLGWKVVAVNPQATVADLADANADLLLTVELSQASDDPRHVVVDLCLADESPPVIQAMTANMDGLEQAVAATAKSAAP